MNGGLGDVKSIASTTFQDAGLPILDGTCSLHRQASFYAANFPQGTKVAEDGDIFAFYLPRFGSNRGATLGLLGATVTTTAWYVMGDPFGIDDIYIVLITPALVMLIEWLVRDTQSERELVRP